MTAAGPRTQVLTEWNVMNLILSRTPQRERRQKYGTIYINYKEKMYTVRSETGSYRWRRQFPEGCVKGISGAETRAASSEWVTWAASVQILKPPVDDTCT